MLECATRTGTFAIVSIMVSVPVVDMAINPPDYVKRTSVPANISDTGLAYEVDGMKFANGSAFRIAIATSLALLIGLIQVCMNESFYTCSTICNSSVYFTRAYFEDETSHIYSISIDY